MFCGWERLYLGPLRGLGDVWGVELAKKGCGDGGRGVWLRL